MHRIAKRCAWLLGASSLVALQAGAAAAQTAESHQTSLSEIVVTANRRAENLQEVPIAVSALTAEALKATGVTSTGSLQVAVPGLSTGQQVAMAAFFLRGVGAQSGSLGTESPIAIYVDDVYLVAPSASLFDFNGVERIEVLKGPQGTLFGRNATGGVIHVISKDPGPGSKLDATVGYANYDTFSGDLYASHEFSDTVRANLSLNGSKQRDGWGKNLNNGEDVYLGWSWGARGKVVWTPTDETRVRLQGDYSSLRNQIGMAIHPQPGSYITGCVPATVACRIGYIGFYNTLDLHADTYSGGTVLTPAKNITDYYTVKQGGLNLKVNQDLGVAQLVSISSWRKSLNHFYLDQDGGPVVTSDSDIFQRVKNYSQELQLQSPEGSKVSWILGGFFLNNVDKYDPYANKGAGRVSNTLVYYGTQKTRSVAVFGQTIIPVMSDTNLTLGARYTRDRRTVSARFVSLNPAGVAVSSGDVIGNPGVSLTTKWPKVTYRAALDHKFTEDFMVYASLNRGFKSGVYSLLVPPPGPAPTVSRFAAPAAPEVLDAYEAGFKSEWMDRRVRFNATTFLYDYTNLQVTSIATGITSVINAGKARIKGLELELTALPVENLSVTVAASIQDGKYKTFPGAPHNVPQGTPGTPLTAGSANICNNLPFPANSVGGMVSGVAPGNSGCDLSGRKTIRTPPFTVSLSGSYLIPMTSGDIRLNGSFTHTASYFWEFDNSVKSPPSDIFNASATWTSPGGRYDVTLWGKNLTGEKTYSYANNTTLGTGFSPGAPATYGVKFGLHWDAAE